MVQVLEMVEFVLLDNFVYEGFSNIVLIYCVLNKVRNKTLVNANNTYGNINLS